MTGNRQRFEVAGGKTDEGLRERNKKDRLLRIKEAAFETFRTEGFEAANTRSIAARAQVSVGTIFSYAKDKHDLLCLVLNEDLDQIFATAVAGVTAKGQSSDRVLALLEPIYLYFGREPQLAQAIDREVATFKPAEGSGEQSRRFFARMARWYAAVEHILESAQSQGCLELGEDRRKLAVILFDVHLAVVRRCLQSKNVDFSVAFEELRGLVRAVIDPRSTGLTTECTTVGIERKHRPKRR